MSLVHTFSLVSVILAAAVLPCLGYLGLLTLFSAAKAAPPVGKRTRFVIVVPAHNEESQIATTVGSLRAVDYPADMFRVLVVADNCSDATAVKAKAAGAEVIERHHDSLRGKGYALEYAFNFVLAEGKTDAVVVVDADTLVSKSLLGAFAARLESGALAAQAEYGVSNPFASWRTQLMTVALAMFHGVRSLGRERLAVSAGLRGNGMCFSTQLLRAHPHKAFGLVEDVEYGIAIGRAGVRIAYAHEAKVYGEMVSSAQASQTQRQRWEGGRLQLIKQELPSLITQALRQRSAMLMDLALDVAIPPLSYLGLAVVLGLGLEAGLLILGQQALGAGAVLWALNAACLFAYVARGVMLSGLGWRGVWALLFAPIYILWKILLMLKPGRKDGAWIRTRRESES